MKQTTADDIRRTADEIEETTERVRELAEQNVTLTRQAHKLVHDSPDLASTIEGVEGRTESDDEEPGGADESPP